MLTRYFRSVHCHKSCTASEDDDAFTYLGTTLKCYEWYIILGRKMSYKIWIFGALIGPLKIIFPSVFQHNYSKKYHFLVRHFPPIFDLFKIVKSVFQKLAKQTIFGILNKLLSTQNVNGARFARNVECGFFCDFQTL